MIYQVYAIASSLRYRRNAPERDFQFLRFIRQFPCVGCGASRWIEASHTGPHGLGQKASDLDALPMCAACHRTGPQALHKVGPVKFQFQHKIDFAELRGMFQQWYRAGKHEQPEPATEHSDLVDGDHLRDMRG
jgi:hypothetical protein